MQVNRKAATGARATVEINLGRGAVLIARPLDAFEHKFVVAEAHAELNALLAGEPSKRVWASITKERLAEAKQSEESRSALLMWMHGVLLATKSGVALTGVEEVSESGDVIGALDASFETFELIFADVLTESMFKAQSMKIESIWSAEKNVSGPGPNGSGPEVLNTAAPAKTPATLAPAEASAAQTAPSKTSDGAAPSRSTPPAPPKANSHGPSPEAAAAGASPA